MKKKILILGGEGYIGQIVSKKIMSNNYSVVSYDNLIYEQKRLNIFEKNENFEFVHGDLQDQDLLTQSLQDVFGVIILAGLVGDPITKKYPELSNDINYSGIKKVIDLLILNNVKRIIFVSTCSNYGLIKDNETADEDFVLNPLSFYAKAKVDIEKYILSMKNKVNNCFTIFRFATAFGLSTRMRYDLTVNEFTREIYNKKDLEVYDPDTWRPYCHVEDFANLLLLALETPENKISFEVFNVGMDNNNFTKRMIVEKIQEFIPTKRVYFVNKPGTDPRNYRVNFSKLKEQLGYQCQFSVEDGIKEIINQLENNIEDKNDQLGNYQVRL
tara:strand:+ start:4373 stop:5356 length:984 start_codon:yes stop_codon:yes gene_type:complete